MIYVSQRDTDAVINLNKIEINFEFPIAKFKNSSRSEIESEIEDIFNFNSDAGKSNKEPHLISHLYTAISV